jgi:hypothetical protein
MNLGEFGRLRVRVVSASDPKRVRSAVLHKGDHIGYVTVITYPGRDLTAFSEGSPYSEFAVSDLAEKHVVLLQRFKEHWLIHCGTTYGTTDGAGELTGTQVMQLAVLVLRHRDHTGPVLVAALKSHVEKMLGLPRRANE